MGSTAFFLFYLLVLHCAWGCQRQSSRRPDLQENNGCLESADSHSRLQLYGVPLNEAEADRLLFNRRLDLAHSAAALLDKHNLVKYDRRTGNLQVGGLIKRKLAVVSLHVEVT